MKRRQTDLAMALLKQYLFVVEAVNIHKNCAVYRTTAGGIFAVFGKGSKIKKFVNNDATLSDLYATYDLRQKPQDFQKEYIENLCKKAFGSGAKKMLGKMLNISEYMHAHPNTKLDNIKERIKLYDPKHDPKSKTYAQLMKDKKKNG